MNRFRDILIVICAILFTLCGKSPTTPVPTTGIIIGKILKASDSTAIPQANIILYNANTNAPVTRVVSGSDGSFEFEVAASGNYYLKVSAQNFLPSPPMGGEAVAFAVAIGDTADRSLYLDAYPAAHAFGGISGYVRQGSAGVPGVLVVASNGSNAVSGVTGPDGYYILYNVTSGSYALNCYREGYRQDTAQVTVQVAADSIQTGINLSVTNNAAAAAAGSLQCLATNGPDSVDVTLVNPLTREAVPGLVVMSGIGGAGWRLNNVPPGSYIVWATYRNDGYVMDPDAIFKHGLPSITVPPVDTLLTITTISITGAVPLVSPTNKPDSLFPEEITAATPLFKWTKESSFASAKEFIIEVFDIRGNSIWGGFDSTGVLRCRAMISGAQDSAIYNFDSSATQALQAGQSYRWKVYADANASPGVQQLLSASEDLMGLFKVIK